MRGKSARVPSKELDGWWHSYLGHSLDVDSSVVDEMLSEEALFKGTKLKS
jgi:hypothetical protein